MENSAAGVQQALAGEQYIATSQIATVLFLADSLGKPLLVEGPAGVGKTELAKAWAAVTGRELIRLQCYEGLDESKALYEWEYAKQMLYTQLLRDKLNTMLADASSLVDAADRLAAEEDVFFSERFLLQRPLLKAIMNPNPTLLLIDEVDRCIAEGSLVMTTNGPVPVELLEIGDELVGFDPGRFERTTVRLKSIHQQQVEKVLRIVVGGRLLFVTPEHRFVRFEQDGNYQVVQARDLRVGDTLPIDRTIPDAKAEFSLPLLNDEILKISETGRRILNQRIRETGLTQREAAGVAGVSFNHLRNVIMPSSFRESLRSGVLEKLCEEIDQNFEEFQTEHTAGLRPKRCTELFELLGYITGDGCYTVDHLIIPDKDEELLRSYGDKFEVAFGAKPIIGPGPHRNFVLEYHSLPLGRWLIPFMGPALNRSRQRRLPEWVWGLEQEEQAAVMRGLFDAEGWVADHSVALTSASWKLIVDLQQLLMLHGIEARISTGTGHDNTFAAGKPFYTLQITDTPTFAERINFNSQAKKDRLEQAKAKAPKFHKGDYLPDWIVRPVLEQLRNERTLHTLPKHQAVYDMLSGRISMNRSTLQQLAEAWDYTPLQELVDSNLSLGKITSIDEVEEQTQVYDLTVSGPSYFVANGIISHNSDPELEAFLLEVLSDFQVSIPEIGTLKAKQRPVVLLTSNNTRELSEALKRRCLYLFIDYPSSEEELRIVQLKVPGMAPKLAQQAVELVQRLRKMDLKKSPSVSETLDWARALVLLNADALDPQTLEQTLTVLLKHEADLQRAQRLVQPRNPRDPLDPRDVSGRFGLS